MASAPTLLQSPTTGRSPAAPKFSMHSSIPQRYNIPSPSVSNVQSSCFAFPLLLVAFVSRKVPMKILLTLARSFTTGRLPGWPKEPTQISLFDPHVSHCPSPSSRCHAVVSVSNTPMFDFPSPNQSPITGRETPLPNPFIHLSVV